MSHVAPADDRLAAADPAVAGLREVLDPLALVQRLAPHWHVAAARVDYLRYKPGTSLVAGLVLTDDDGATSVAQALALGDGAPDKLAKVVRAGEHDDVGRGAVVDDRLGVALTDVTADRHLPGVLRVLRADADVRPLVYKPGRRWVARRAREGSAELVKVHRPADLPARVAGYAVLGRLPAVRVSAVDLRRGVVATAWVPGAALDRLDGAAAAGLWARAGAVLAEVHAQPRSDGLTRVDRAAALAAAVTAVHAVLPGLAADARSVADRVQAALAGTSALGVVHGDFSADQVIARPDLARGAGGAASGPAAPGQPGVTLVDLDRVGLDDPVADLASWYGALVAAGGEAREPEDVLAPLLAGYAGGAPGLERLRAHCAAAVLQRAAEPFRRHQPDWPWRMARLVGVARELAA